MSLFIPGLLSITLRQSSVEEIIALCGQAGLKAIEWGGDIHVPAGDLETAQRVGFLTRARGLVVTAYGSYYRMGVSEEPFEVIADTAVALGAPVVRIWVGNRGSADADKAWREQMAREALRIAQIARSRDLRIAYEYHGGTLTDTLESTRDFLAATDSPILGTLWQPAVGWSQTEHENSLRDVLPRLQHLHVFHWLKTGARRPLAEGADAWAKFLEILRERDRPTPLLLEFVENDDPQQVLRDATTLLSWIQ